MPKAHKPHDKVFQISCVLGRQGSDSKDYTKILLSLGSPDQNDVGDDVIIKAFSTEADLLMGYVDIVNIQSSIDYRL